MSVAPEPYPGAFLVAVVPRDMLRYAGVEDAPGEQLLPPGDDPWAMATQVRL